MASNIYIRNYRILKVMFTCTLSNNLPNGYLRLTPLGCTSLNKIKTLNVSSFYTTTASFALENLKDIALASTNTDKPNVGIFPSGINTGHKDDSITSADVPWTKDIESNALAPCEEDVSDICPFTQPSFNLAAYVNQSHTLQELVKMGVDLHRIEGRRGASECILKLDFDKHIKDHLRFLHDNGLLADEFGYFVTKNPFIFEHPLEDLQVRINYLEAKKFSSSAITRIISKNPDWLNFSTVEIDKRLGFFQRTFILSGDEVRHLATRRPQLITYDLGKVSISSFAVRENMGFNEKEVKTLILNSPKLFTISKKALVERFDYVHNIMAISHERILQYPSVLLFRNYIVKQRHEFLKEIGKVQYNPTLPGYVSLESLVQGSDVDFCTNVAKTSIEVFNAFLKTT